MELLGHRLVGLLVLCASLPIARLAHGAPPSTTARPAASSGLVALDDDAIKAVNDYITDLETHLLKAVKEDSTGQSALLESALFPANMERELKSFIREVTRYGEPARLRFSSFEVKPTLWFGVVPIQQGALAFWRGKDRTRLLRLKQTPGLQRVFGHPSAPTWDGDTAKAFGILAEQILSTATKGQCDRLPLVHKSDYEHMLPGQPEQMAHTVRIVARFSEKAQQACQGFAKYTYNRMTWTLGELAGSLKTKKGDSLSFRLALAPGPKQKVRVLHLGKPIGTGPPAKSP